MTYTKTRNFTQTSIEDMSSQFVFLFIDLISIVTIEWVCIDLLLDNLMTVAIELTQSSQPSWELGPKRAFSLNNIGYSHLCFCLSWSKASLQASLYIMPLGLVLLIHNNQKFKSDWPTRVNPIQVASKPMHI